MKRKRWSTEEINYLKETIGHRSISDIALKLCRSEIAISEKAKRLGLGETKSLTGRVTSGELARLLTVDRNTVMTWVNKFGLPAVQKVTAIKKQYVLISPEEFWSWASEHREKIDFRKLEKNSFPPEPQWAETERQHPSHVQRKYQHWKTSEDAKLASLIDQGLSYEDISNIMNRTQYSVERRYHRIKGSSDYYKGKNEYAVKRGERTSLSIRKK